MRAPTRYSVQIPSPSARAVRSPASPRRGTAATIAAGSTQPAASRASATVVSRPGAAGARSGPGARRPRDRVEREVAAEVEVACGFVETRGVSRSASGRRGRVRPGPNERSASATATVPATVTTGAQVSHEPPRGHDVARAFLRAATCVRSGRRDREGDVTAQWKDRVRVGFCRCSRRTPGFCWLRRDHRAVESGATGQAPGGPFHVCFSPCTPVARERAPAAADDARRPERGPSGPRRSAGDRRRSTRLARW